MSEISFSVLNVFFVFTTFLCMYLGYRVLKSSHVTNKHAVKICSLMFGWLLLQAFLSLGAVYSSEPNSLPPKIVLYGIVPNVLLILALFSFSNSRKALNSFSLESLAMLSIVRIPVELALLFLFMHKLVPQIMTFEGRNFDILSGLTAPLIVYFFHKTDNRKILLAWHFICLGLLLNIVIIAFLSAPTPLQKFGFEQPNLAIVQFPYCWLPTFIVPWVLFTHLVSILKLLLKRPLNQ